MKRLFENFYVTGQLTNSDFAKIAEAGIATIINNRPDDEEPNQLNSSQAKQLAEQHGLEYYYLPMVAGQPLKPSLVDDFKQVLDNTDKPTLAHCRTGMRSSILWSMGQISSGVITADQAIEAAQAIGIPLNDARAVLESITS